MNYAIRLLLGTAIGFTPSLAHAQTVGEMLTAISEDIWGPFFFLIACVSFIAGLALLAIGLMKLTRQHENRGGIWEGGFAHIVAAAFLLSLPDAAGVGLMTVFGDASGAYALTGLGLDFDGAAPTMGGDPNAVVNGVFTSMAHAGQVQNCLSMSSPATCMARNLAVNAAPMAIWTLFGLTFLVGLASFASAIFDITKQQNQGGLPRGWTTKIVTSVLLMNSATLFTFVTRTVLGRDDGPINEQGLNDGSSMLSYPVDSSIEVIRKYAEMIGYCFTILAFFGAWAFVRGIFHIRSTAEGRNNQGSYGMGIVFIVAGILLANAKYSACVILTTMGGEGMSQGFCD